MSRTDVEMFDNTLQKTNGWLKDLSNELDWENRHKAYLALRAVLQVLRDRLPVEEVAQLGAQLPMLVRGFYYEGWDPTGKPLKERHKDNFLKHIEVYFRNEDLIDPEKVVRAVFKLLTKRISEGEIEDVKHILPAELRRLWT